MNLDAHADCRRSLTLTARRTRCAPVRLSLIDARHRSRPRSSRSRVSSTRSIAHHCRSPRPSRSAPFVRHVVDSALTRSVGALSGGPIADHLGRRAGILLVRRALPALLTRAGLRYLRARRCPADGRSESRGHVCWPCDRRSVRRPGTCASVPCLADLDSSRCSVRLAGRVRMC